MPVLYMTALMVYTCATASNNCGLVIRRHMILLWYRPLNCDLLQVSMDLPHYTLCCTALRNTEKVSIKNQETHVLI